MDKYVRHHIMLQRAKVIIRKELRKKGHKAKAFTNDQITIAARRALQDKRFYARCYHWVWRHYNRGGK